MLRHMFFIVDENWNEVNGELLGELNDFTSFNKASAAARKLSKRAPGRFSVACCSLTGARFVPGGVYENGKNLGVL